MKKVFIITLITSLLFGITTSAETISEGKLIEKNIFIESGDEVNNRILVNDDECSYTLIFKEYKSSTPKIETEEKEISIEKEVIHDTDNIDEILAKSDKISYSEDGFIGELTPSKVLKVEESSYSDNYFETTESFTEVIQHTSNDPDTLVKNKTVDNKNYYLTHAEFTPIKFENNKPILFSVTQTWTTIIPHYDKSISSWKAIVEYTGKVKKENEIGREVVALYEVTNYKNNNFFKNIVGTVVGGSSFIAVIFFIICTYNVIISTNDKKLRKHRVKINKNNEVIVDVSKELKVTDSLDITLKKKLTKKFNNTKVIIKENNRILLTKTFNRSINDLKINI